MRRQHFYLFADFLSDFSITLKALLTNVKANLSNSKCMVIITLLMPEFPAVFKECCNVHLSFKCLLISKTASKL